LSFWYTGEEVFPKEEAKEKAKQPWRWIGSERGERQREEWDVSLVEGVQGNYSPSPAFSHMCDHSQQGGGFLL
jgi:hypothetical protein